MTAAYETALSKFERAEDNMRNLLEERRNKKVARLTPHFHKNSSHLHTHKVTHTYSPQATTSGRRMLGQFPVRARKGKGPSCAENHHTPYRRPARTPDSTINRPTLLPSPTTPNVSADAISGKSPDLDEIHATLSNLVSQLNSKMDGLPRMRKLARQPFPPSKNPSVCELHEVDVRIDRCKC